MIHAKGATVEQTHQDGLVVRSAARVLLLDAEDRLLMFHCQDPTGGEPFWIAPGGGLEANESYEDAARREVYEETGLRIHEVSCCVWHRTHAFTYRHRRYNQHERFFVARTDATVIRAIADDQEIHDQLGHHWWSVEELQRSTSDFAPRRIAQYLSALLNDGYPDEPIDVGV
ncbi:NUDIX hydrolase [Phycisphaerales bacterium AB-hyl4]|uniref:NUDIX hydrolase n=1 Tax=Natronomicrosphaera hydrolytica TaxID=3242702 RepID=A0ABV4UAL8_9BACT